MRSALLLARPTLLLAPLLLPFAVPLRRAPTRSGLRRERSSMAGRAGGRLRRDVAAARERGLEHGTRAPSRLAPDRCCRAPLFCHSRVDAGVRGHPAAHPWILFQGRFIRWRRAQVPAAHREPLWRPRRGRGEQPRGAAHPEPSRSQPSRPGRFNPQGRRGPVARRAGARQPRLEPRELDARGARGWPLLSPVSRLAARAAARPRRPAPVDARARRAALRHDHARRALGYRAAADGATGRGGRGFADGRAPGGACDRHLCTAVRGRLRHLSRGRGGRRRALAAAPRVPGHAAPRPPARGRARPGGGCFGLAASQVPLAVDGAAGRIAGAAAAASPRHRCDPAPARPAALRPPRHRPAAPGRALPALQRGRLCGRRFRFSVAGHRPRPPQCAGVGAGRTADHRARHDGGRPRHPAARARAAEGRSHTGRCLRKPLAGRGRSRRRCPRNAGAAHGPRRLRAGRAARAGPAAPGALSGVSLDGGTARDPHRAHHPHHAERLAPSGESLSTHVHARDRLLARPDSGSAGAGGRTAAYAEASRSPCAPFPWPSSVSGPGSARDCVPPIRSRRRGGARSATSTSRGGAPSP